MASQTLRQCGIASTIDVLSEDLLQNIFARLPATSFASAACVRRSWNLVCDRVLCRPKLASACSCNRSLEDAVKDVVNKVLSEPIRPHFAIASIGGAFDEEDALEEAHQLITAALGFKVPVVTNRPRGIIGRDAVSNKINEIDWYFGKKIDAVMLIVGFLPGLKVATIPLLKQVEEPETEMIDEFVTDIREFSTSVSGCSSPAVIIAFGDHYFGRMWTVIEKLHYAMSPETIIVGDGLSQFRCTTDAQLDTSVGVALIFAVDKNKPPGIGETQFHAVLSSGLSPVGPIYEVASASDNLAMIAVRREGSLENIEFETVLNQVYDEIRDQTQNRDLYIGVTKKRKCSIGQENAPQTPILDHAVRWLYKDSFFVGDWGIKTGDTFRLYHSSITTLSSAAAAVSSHLRSFNQGSNNATGGDKLEVFGGLLFTDPDIFDQPVTYSSPFLDNFPDVTLGGTFCIRVIGRRFLTPYVKESQEQKVVNVACTRTVLPF